MKATKHEKAFKVVYFKEMKAIFRDKRMMASLFAPIIIMPAFVAVIGFIIFSFMTQTVTVGINDLNSPLVTAIQSETPNVEFVQITDAVQQIQSGEIIASVDVPLDFQQKIDQFQPVEIQVVTEPSNQKAESITGSISSYVTKQNAALLDTVLTNNGIDIQTKNLVTITEASLSSSGEIKEPDLSDTILSSVASFIPMLLIFASVGGVLAIATELGAAEKEKNSFEILLATKADRGQIITGKLLTILTFGLLSFLSFCVVIGIFIAVPALFFPGIAENLGTLLSPITLLLLATILILTSFFISCLSLIISMSAKSYKEAQSYLGYLSLVLIIPSYLTMFSDIRNIPFWQLNIPLINHIAIMKQIISGIFIWQNIAIVIVWSIIYILLTIYSLRYFLTKEKFLFR